jgi:methionyl aminopeptidase
VEAKIISLGGKPAFPVQLSLNRVAAHYCPDTDEKTAFTDQVAKLDIGVHVEGCIGDAACTVDLSGENKELVEAPKKALEEAIKAIKPGVKVFEVGEAIRNVISSYGFAPVRNLCGHGLEKFDVHAKPSVLNFNNGDASELKEGQVVAIEPFATTGAGIVIETSNPTVFVLKEKKPVRDITTRHILKEIEAFEGLPFAKRWLTKKFPFFKVNFALKQLAQLDAIIQFPPLAEKEKKLVSQAEHSLIVKDKPEILTSSA